MTVFFAALGTILGTASWAWIWLVHRNPEQVTADERAALFTWEALSPEARQLIARAARSVAKDYIQEELEARGLPYTEHGGSM